MKSTHTTDEINMDVQEATPEVTEPPKVPEAPPTSNVDSEEPKVELVQEQKTIEVKEDKKANFLEELIKAKGEVDEPEVRPNPEGDIEFYDEIKSDRGRDRMKKILTQKRDLEKQIEDLKEALDRAKVAPVAKVMSEASEPEPLKQKKPFNYEIAVTHLKESLDHYLEDHKDEFDHVAKMRLITDYLNNPFILHSFLKEHDETEIRGAIRHIYQTLQLPKATVAKYQPLHARTASLGAPLSSSLSPVDRIAQHLSNMGI
jgi:hypothetical protein